MLTSNHQRSWPQRITALGVVLLVAVGALAASPASAIAGPNEGDFFGAANAARSSAGLSSYSYAGDLAAAARAQAERMAASGQLYHNPDLGSAVSNWQGLAENVGTGTDWQTIQQALMDSPDHRAAILDPVYTQMGVGTAVDKGGTLWVAEVFRLPAGTIVPTSSSGTPSDATASPTGVSPTTTVAPAPTPTQILRSKIRNAREKLDHSSKQHRGGDPLVAALDYSTVMNTVGG